MGVFSRDLPMNRRHQECMCELAILLAEGAHGFLAGERSLRLSLVSLVSWNVMHMTICDLEIARGLPQI
jgi:hypothetical protein